MSSILKNTRYLTRVMLGQHRAGYEILRRIPSFRERCVHGNTGCVIEGFPRSGNSFFLNVFKKWNPDVRVAHHVHVPQQVLYGVRQGLPVVVLIRNPIDALSSLLIADESLSVTIAINSYLAFYEKLLPVIANTTIGHFEECTTRPHEIIRKINRSYKKQYLFNEVLTKEEKEAIFRGLTEHNERMKQSENLVPVPSERKEILKNKVRDRIASNRNFISASNLYQKILSKDTTSGTSSIQI